MEFNINLIWLPIFMPFLVAGKSFLDHSDFKMAFEALFSKKAILFTIFALIFALIFDRFI